MTLSVRRLTAEDAERSQRLAFEAFGMPATPPPAPPTVERPGRLTWGAFDGDRLVGQLSDRDFDSYFGGVAVSTSGIAGVTVAAEFRGRGVLTLLFTAALAAARQRSAVISTLFPTAARIYRRFGYELVGEGAEVQVPSQVLASVTRPDAIMTRRAEAADAEAVRVVYDRWAEAQNGPLTRRGPSFVATDQELVDATTGVTLAVDADGRVCGFASWNRGQGYGEPAVLEVSDLLALTPGAYQALLAAVGSFASVTPTTRIATSGDDPIRYFLPTARWSVVSSDPYMLAVLDVAGAFSARGYPSGVTADLRFGLAGAFPADADGAYRLQVSAGAGCCVREDHTDRVFGARGLALLYAGVQSCANLRLAGMLNGGDVAEDGLWDALFGGRQLHIRNYF